MLARRCARRAEPFPIENVVGNAKCSCVDATGDGIRVATSKILCCLFRASVAAKALRGVDRMEPILGCGDKEWTDPRFEPE